MKDGKVQNATDELPLQIGTLYYPCLYKYPGTRYGVLDDHTNVNRTHFSTDEVTIPLLIHVPESTSYLLQKYFTQKKKSKSTCKM